MDFDRSFGRNGRHGGPIIDDERRKDLGDFNWNDSVSTFGCSSS
jgi:hypothetical protein